MSNPSTRRNPEMERFTEIVPVGDEWRVRLKVGVQSFDIGMDMETREEAEFVRDMLCIALAKIASSDVL